MAQYRVRLEFDVEAAHQAGAVDEARRQLALWMAAETRLVWDLSVEPASVRAGGKGWVRVDESGEDAPKPNLGP